MQIQTLPSTGIAFSLFSLASKPNPIWKMKQKIILWWDKMYSCSSAPLPILPNSTHKAKVVCLCWRILWWSPGLSRIGQVQERIQLCVLDPRRWVIYLLRSPPRLVVLPTAPSKAHRISLVFSSVFPRNSTQLMDTGCMKEWVQKE